MKSELKITTGLAAALLTAACSSDDSGWTADRDTAVCTDRSGVRVADENCQRSYAHGGGVSPFLWYYLGRNSAIPYYGERVAGGSFTGVAGRSYARAPAGSAMTRSTAISRGGFGESAHGFGGAGE